MRKGLAHRPCLQPSETETGSRRLASTIRGGTRVARGQRPSGLLCTEKSFLEMPPPPPSGHGSPSWHVPSVSAPGHQPGCVGLGGGGGCADVTAVTWRQCPPAPSHSMRSKPTLLEGNFANSKDWGPQTLILPPAFLFPAPRALTPSPSAPLSCPWTSLALGGETTAQPLPLPRLPRPCPTSSPDSCHTLPLGCWEAAPRA